MPPYSSRLGEVGMSGAESAESAENMTTRLD